MKRIFVVFCQLFLLAPLAGISGQSAASDEKKDQDVVVKEKALKLLREVANEASGLRLWENRALILASAGDIQWETDQKKALKLFRDAEGELMNGVMVKAPKTGDFLVQYTARSNFSSRRPVLLTIASRDAAAALQMFYRTRPAETQAALGRGKVPKLEGVEKTQIEIEQTQRDQRLTTEENSLEQAIIKSSVEQDPKKAAEAIRSSLKQGVSNETMGLLKKVYEFDADLATELISEVIDKIGDSDLSSETTSELHIVQQILIEADKSSKAGKSDKRTFPAPSKPDMQKLADKIADAYLGRKNLFSLWGFSAVVEILKANSPAKANALDAKAKEINDSGPDYIKTIARADEFLKDESKTPKELVSAARDFSMYQKTQLYKKAIGKAGGREGLKELRQILTSEEQGAERDNALTDLDRELSKLIIKDGDLAAVRELIDTAETDKGKLRLIVELATEFQRKGDKESISTAVKLMKEATIYVGQIPEDAEDTENMLLIASGFAEVDPESALTYLEGLSTMANDLLLADSLRAKYDKRSVKFIEGEAIFANHASSTYANYGKPLKALATADFDGTLKTIDRIDRDDIRTLLRMLLIQAVFKEKIGFEGNRGNSFTFFSTG